MSDAQANQFEPDFLPPPGETLLEALAERGISQAQLAERTGRPKKTINEIIRGRAEITPETALQLERVLGIPAHFWNGRERQYREALVRQKERNALLHELDWLKRLPIAQMVKLGWLPPVKDPVEKLRAVLNFFGVASPNALKDWTESKCLHFRKSSAHAENHLAVCAWIRRGEIKAQQRRCEPYSEARFRENLQAIRALTRQPVEVFEPDLVRLTAEAGVATVFIPQLSGVPAWGMTQWLTSDKAVIQLSLRYKTDDHLWFTFFHEAGHILLHGKKDVFLEFNGDKDEREKEADQFAANFLIPPSHMQRIRMNPPRSATAATALARELGISPGIVVGRLQHENLLPRSHLNALRRRLDFAANRGGRG